VSQPEPYRTALDTARMALMRSRQPDRVISLAGRCSL